jgi:sec-independent protein translocase protein TatB
VFFDIGPLEWLSLIVLGIVLFGPDKLPSMARNAARTLQQFREFTQGAREDLKRELGPEFDGIKLEDLNPKTFVRKNLLGEDDPFGLHEIQTLNEDFKLTLDERAPAALTADEKLAPGERPPFDADAT